MPSNATGSTRTFRIRGSGEFDEASVKSGDNPHFGQAGHETVHRNYGRGTMPSSVVLRIKLRDEEESTDHIPFEWFALVGTLDNKEHRVTYKDGSDLLAKCKVDVFEDHAYLHYDGDYEEYNRNKGFFVGTTRIEFHDGGRNGIRRVKWRREKERQFKSYNGDWRIELNERDADEPEGQDTGKPSIYIGRVVQYVRDSRVARQALERANGKCEECGNPAPFVRASTGEPYLEVHHETPLAAGGSDTMDNVVALCPNCHRKRHYG